MIEITIKRQAESFEMVIKGHAHFAEKGKDIVCAAVSTLVQTLADQLIYVTDSYTIKFDKRQIKSIKAAGSKIGPVLDTIITGLMMIQAEYPNYFKLHVSTDAAASV